MVKEPFKNLILKGRGWSWGMIGNMDPLPRKRYAYIQNLNTISGVLGPSKPSMNPRLSSLTSLTHSRRYDQIRDGK